MMAIDPGRRMLLTGIDDYAEPGVFLETVVTRTGSFARAERLVMAGLIADLRHPEVKSALNLYEVAEFDASFGMRELWEESHFLEYVRASEGRVVVFGFLRDQDRWAVATGVSEDGHFIWTPEGDERFDTGSLLGDRDLDEIPAIDGYSPDGQKLVTPRGKSMVMEMSRLIQLADAEIESDDELAEGRLAGDYGVESTVGDYEATIFLGNEISEALLEARVDEPTQVDDFLSRLAPIADQYAGTPEAHDLVCRALREEIMGEGLAMRCANGFVLRDDGSASPPGLVATREIISRLPAMLATSEPERMQRRLAELKRGANTQS